MRYSPVMVFLKYLFPTTVLNLKVRNSKIFCPNLGCRICCTVYSPQANARERMNRTLNVALRSYAREDHRQWDAYLPRVNCALRNTKHEARDKTPYQIVFRLQMITHSQDFKLLRKLQVLEEHDLELQREDKFFTLRDRIQEKMGVAYEKYLNI